MPFAYTRLLGSASAWRGAARRKCDASRYIMLPMGFARSLLTSRPNNACDSTRYAEISHTERRDVWHGATRTNGPYIRRIRAVNCRPPPASRPVRRGLAAHLWIERPGNHDRISTVAAINMWSRYIFTLKTWLISWFSDLLEQFLFLVWEIFYCWRYFTWIFIK